MEIEFFGRSFFFVLVSIHLQFWLCCFGYCLLWYCMYPVSFTMLTYQFILFYMQIQIPVRTGTQQLATEMPLHMLPYSMVLCVCSVVVDC